MRAHKSWPATASSGRAGRPFLYALAAVLFLACAPSILRAQDRATDPAGLTQLQLEIQKQRRRLNSSETEERRDDGRRQRVGDK